MFSNGSHAKLQSLCKQIFQNSNKAIFESSVQKLEDFLDEKPGQEKLKYWLKWSMLRKAYKHTLSLNSNVTEVIHSSWVSRKTGHLFIYECTLDDLVDRVYDNQTNAKNQDVLSSEWGDSPNEASLDYLSQE